MPTIPKKTQLVKNAIAQQVKKAANSLTIQEWNEVINILKTQANANTKYLDDLHRTLFGDYDNNTTGYWEFDTGFLTDILEAITQVKADITIMQNQINAMQDVFKFNVFHEQGDFELTFTNGICDQAGTMFYDIEHHTMVLITDLGEFHEMGLNLGDIAKYVPRDTNDDIVLFEGMIVTLTGVQGASPVKLCAAARSDDPDLSMTGVITTTENNLGYAGANSFTKVSIFGDISVPYFSEIFEGCFVASAGLGANQEAFLTMYNNKFGTSITNLGDVQQGLKLYLSASDYGRYTFDEPERPNEIVWVASILNVNNNNTGRIYVYPQVLRQYGASVLHYVELGGVEPAHVDSTDMIIQFTED